MLFYGKMQCNSGIHNARTWFSKDSMMVRPGCASRSLLCAFSMSFFTSSFACRAKTMQVWACSMQL